MNGAEPLPEASLCDGPASAGMDRRRMFAAAGGGALTLTLAACSGGDDGDGPDGPTEVSELTDLIELERRAAATLASGARFSQGAESREFTDLERDSLAHVVALEGLIETAGGTPPPAPDVPIAAFVRDPDSARVASLAISERLIKGYLGAIDLSVSPERRRGMTTLLANIAQRKLVLGGLRQASPTLVQTGD
jgi:hypothetical protein